MPWQEKSIMSQKQKFVQSALEGGVPFTKLCEEYGISRTLGYDLVKRYLEKGVAGLEPRSKIPYQSPNKTPPKMEEQILNVRQKYPTWGPRKIKAYLLRQEVKDLPAVSTINEILKRNGCISQEESLKRKELIRFERAFPNELWQMDFKGHFQLKNKQSCYPLTILDDHSRFSLCLKACVDEALLPVRNQLIRVFKKYGLPTQINVDNGGPWGNSSLVRHTTLTVWLMQLDVLVTHSRPRHPQTNGKDERFHRTLKEDILKDKIANFTVAQRLFDKWRNIYNFERPHEGINMLVPADRYESSLRHMPTKICNVEYSEGAIVRRISKSNITFQKKDYLIGKGFIGHYVELRPCEETKLLNIYFGKHKIYTYDLT